MSDIDLHRCVRHYFHRSNNPPHPKFYYVYVAHLGADLVSPKTSDFKCYTINKHTPAKFGTIGNQLPNRENCDVKLGTHTVLDDTLISILDIYRDGIVCLHLKPRGISGTPQRSPLQPLSAINSTRRSSSNQGIPSSTSPLKNSAVSQRQWPSGHIQPPGFVPSSTQFQPPQPTSKLSSSSEQVFEFWPIKYRDLIARHVAVKLMEINAKNVSYEHIKNLLDQATSYFDLLARIEEDLEIDCGEDELDLAKYITDRIPEDGTRFLVAEVRLIKPTFDPYKQNKPDGLSIESQESSRKYPESEESLRLKELVAKGTPESLETEVKSDVVILSRLVQPLSGLALRQDATHWLTQVQNVQKLNVPTPTIIGVVGNTGAGKSSVINALLDEERLVPTNCMRACTAVVTEMSWNFNDDEACKYRAEIEFISIQDWEKELKVLFDEMLDGSGKVSREASTADSEAGIAYSKIKAVYPYKTNEQLASSSVQALLNEPNVQGVLGSTKLIGEAEPDRFYKQLQRYVDSGEKKKDDKDKKKTEMEFWPLIKVVKIYTKSDALSTGAVIVDLPGVHDHNAARSAIAQKYMKQCTGLWIVAPINRAVDDKAAKSLLGESFKRQLKYDGTYSRITFICSKTDDISIIEASEGLGLQAEMTSKFEISDKIDDEIKDINNQTKELKDSKDLYQDVMDDTDEQIDIWDKLKDDLDDGETVFAPKEQTRKRKCSSNTRKTRKKRVARSNSDENDKSDTKSSEAERAGSSDDDDDDNGGHEDVPLTSDVIDDKLRELRETKKEARRQKLEINLKIEDIKKQLKLKKTEKQQVEAEMNAMCISGRNQYSKGAIQQDFAAGIRELDQENVEEEDAENFNPESDIRDYDEVARSLPVFCVSSRAYQKLSGRLQRDNDVSGFVTIEETEIPQLQAHCKKLTEARRAANCRKFINAYCQLINSMTFWANDDGTGMNLTDNDLLVEAKILKDKLSHLERGLEDAVKSCLRQMKDSLAEHIYEKFEEVIAKAVAQANNVAASWGARVDRDDRSRGGLYWATYKAVTRRHGVFTNSNGLIDFNSQLTEPIMKQLANDWEKAFSRRIPSNLSEFLTSINVLLVRFHQGVEQRAYNRGIGISGLAMLSQQLPIYNHIFSDLQNQMRDLINEQQREANRQFTPVVARALASAYEYCIAERGAGQFQRMKTHMEGYIDAQRQTMFTTSTTEVKKHLDKMCREIENQMADKVDEIFLLMRRDYLSVITGTQLDGSRDAAKWSKAERSLRAEVAQILTGIDGLDMESKVKEDSSKCDGPVQVKDEKEEISSECQDSANHVNEQSIDTSDVTNDIKGSPENEEVKAPKHAIDTSERDWSPELPTLESLFAKAKSQSAPNTPIVIKHERQHGSSTIQHLTSPPSAKRVQDIKLEPLDERNALTYTYRTSSHDLLSPTKQILTEQSLSYKSPDIPEYLKRRLDSCRSRFPEDAFSVRDVNGDWMISCDDCGGKLYRLTNGMFNNFETHLKSSTHTYLRVTRDLRTSKSLTMHQA